MIEVTICIALSTRGMQAFAYYLSGSEVVAEITQRMWKASSLQPPHLTFRQANFSPPLTDHRLDLHLLRPQLPTRRHSPRHLPTLVSLPSPRFQLSLDPPLGDIRHQDLCPRIHRMDLLRHHLRRSARLRFLRRGHHGTDLGDPVNEREGYCRGRAEAFLIDWGSRY